MSNKFDTVEGYVSFSHVLTEDEYMGQPVGYSVLLSLDEDNASKLRDKEVKVKAYRGVSQRKFKSGFIPDILDADGGELRLEEELPMGAKVRVLWGMGNKGPHPVHGQSTYISKLKVLDMGNGEIPLDFEEAEDNNDF